METIEFAGVVTALSSVAHNGGESSGIESRLRRERFVQPDGSVEEVPVISGNGLRGLFRDISALHMCRALGYGEPDDTGRPRGLSLPAYYFLFSGGSLVKGGGGTAGIDVDQARELRKTIPMVGIFGGALGNSIMPGKLIVDKAIPICTETIHLLPAEYNDETVGSIWDYTQKEFYTRKDDEKNEHMRDLIDPHVRALIEAEARSKRNAASLPVVVEATGQSQQMMYYVETLAAGTRFYWSISLRDPTPVEFDALVTTLVEFSKKPYIGAKSNVGLGKVSIQFDNWQSIDSRMTPAGNEVGMPLGEAYAAHLRDRAADIRATLAEVR